MGTVILAINNKTGLDQGVSTDSAQTSNPPLGGREGGRVNDPLVSISVEGSGSFELGEVRSVAELGLGVASDDLVLICERTPVLCLLVRSLGIDDGDECRLVQSHL